MEITEKLRERFCKDCNIPIKIFGEPYFSERLKLYDNQYDTIKKWNLFVTELRKYKSEQEYFEDYNRIKDEAINFIKNSKAYGKFLEEDMNRFRISHTELPSSDIYKPSNVKKTFVSIDMKKANFSALRQYSASIFDNRKTWEDFLFKFTSNRHILQSKYIRQVIMGNCNPKRQVAYEKYIMEKILCQMKELITLDRCVFFSNDEIVFDVTGMPMEVVLKLKERAELCPILHKIEVPVTFEYFKLEKIEGADGYIKSILNEDGNITKLDIKCADRYSLPFILRALNKEPVSESDKTFVHEGCLSKFIETPDIKMPEFVMRNYTPPARAYQIEKMYEKFREWNILEQIEIDNPEELDVVLKKSEELELCE